jgi:HlyD family secretion protein
MSAQVDVKQLAIIRDAPVEPQLRRRRRWLSRYVIPGILLAGFGALVAWAYRDAMLPAQPVWLVPVLHTQSAVEVEGTPLFQAAGWIEPRPTPVRVAALAPGVVERLLVVQDQEVKAGEPVAELIKADAELTLQRAEADLKLAEAQLREVEAVLEGARTRLEQPVHLQAALGEAEAILAEIATELNNLPYETQRAEAALEFAERDYQGKLSAEGSVAVRAIQKAESERNSARAMLEELRARADSLALQRAALVARRDALQKQLELLADEKQAKATAEANLQAASARVDQTQVALAEARLRLDRMTVRAPIDGRVYQLLGFPGTNLTGGMSPFASVDGSTVVTLYRPDMLQIRVDVRFEDIPKVSLGQRVLINNPALHEPLSGSVLFVSSEANIQKNTLQVKVGIDAPSAIFKPEMLVEVTFLSPKPAEPAADAEQVARLYLPQQLVLKDESGPFVWLADQSGGVVRKTPVVTGPAAAGGLVEISRGLSMGSRVVARGHENLTDGSRIRVVSEDSEAAGNGGHPPQAHRAMSRLPGEGD